MSAANWKTLDGVDDLVDWFQRHLMRWWRENERTFPWRDTQNPFHILIAEILLQATYSGKVVPIYQELTSRYPTPSALSEASIDDVGTLIRPLGLNHRAAALVSLARALVERHDSTVPSDEPHLLELPGVGPYTAGAVRSFAYGQRAVVADTNVVRVLHRFFHFPLPKRGYAGTTTKTFRKRALEIVPVEGAREFNLAFIDFGALVCTHTKPKCELCPLAARCPSAQLPGDSSR
jgi:A/G-specific adenine glycosylase